jgi:hypothetical protein
MSNQSIQKWNQQGKVYLWRYEGPPRNYPGGHLTADHAGVRSLIQLLELILNSPYSAKALINLSQPAEGELDVPNCSARCMPCRRWLLVYRGDTQDKELWKLSLSNEEVVLETSRQGMESLLKGLRDIAAGKGDYCIGADGSELWFWWRTEH